MYWLGDDDVIKPGSIQKIITCLTSYSPDLVILPLTCFGADLQSCYENPFDFFCDYGMLSQKGAMHFSSLVVNAQKIIGLENKERYIGTYHLYAGCVLDYILDDFLSEKLSIRVLSNDMWAVSAELANKSWSNKLYDIYLNSIPLWFSLLKDEYKNNEKVQKCFSEYKKEFCVGLKFIPCTRITRKVLCVMNGHFGFTSYWLKILYVILKPFDYFLRCIRKIAHLIGFV